MIPCDQAQARLQKLRLARDWRESDMATRLGINTAWYYDVELVEDGLFRELNISMFFQLCRILTVLPVELVSGDKNYDPTAVELQLHVQALLTEGITNDLLTRLNATAWTDLAGDHYFTACDLDGYFEVADLMNIDWRGALMADYRYWLEIQPQDHCHWPDYWDYPSLSKRR